MNQPAQQQQPRIQPGVYKARALPGSEQYATHPESGNEQIAVDFDVPDLGRSLTVFFHFTEKAWPISVDKLRACGWQGNDIAHLAGIDTNEVDVEVKYETWQGKTRMKVDVLGGGGRVQLDNPMDEKQKRMFAARMKQFLGGPPPQPQGQRPAPSNGQQRPTQNGQRQAPQQRQAPAQQGYGPGGEQGGGGFEPEDEIPFASCDVDDGARLFRRGRLRAV